MRTEQFLSHLRIRCRAFTCLGFLCGFVNDLIRPCSAVPQLSFELIEELSDFLVRYRSTPLTISGVDHECNVVGWAICAQVFPELL